MSTDKVDASLSSVSASGAKMSESAKGVKGALSGMGRSAGQAGIQLQQFIGQVQGGQSAMLALSQQSADLGFVLGAPLVGAVVGISASIAGMLLPELFKATEGIIDLDSSISKLTENFDKLSSSQQKVATSVLAERIREQKKEAAGLAKEVNEIESELTSLRTSGGNTGFFESMFGDTPEELEAKLAKVKGSLSVVNLSITENQEKMAGLGDSSKEFAEASTTIADGLHAQVIALAAGEEAAFRYRIAQELGLKAGEAIPQNIEEQITAIYALKAAQEDAAQAATEQRSEDLAQLRGEAQIEAIASRFKDEETLLAEKFERELEMIGENNELKLALEDEYLQALIDMDAAKEDAIAKNKADADKKKLKNTEQRQKTEQSLERQNISSIMAITSALLGHNDTIGKALFIASQGLAASEVFFNTQVAAMRAIAELGPIAGPPVAASIETSGAISIAAIAATTLGSLSASGGGSGGISSGGASQQTTTAQQDFEQETTTFEVDDATAGGSTTQTITFATDSGDELIDAIASALNKAQKDGRV